MRGMKHIADVFDPATSVDDRGQEIGADTLYMQGVFCSIEPLNSRELESARQIYAAATHRIGMYGDPNRPLSHRQYLKINGRRFDIGEIVDVHQNGELYRLTCGEVLP